VPSWLQLWYATKRVSRPSFPAGTKSHRCRGKNTAMKPAKLRALVVARSAGTSRMPGRAPVQDLEACSSPKASVAGAGLRPWPDGRRQTPTYGCILDDVPPTVIRLSGSGNGRCCAVFERFGGGSGMSAAARLRRRAACRSGSPRPAPWSPARCPATARRR
jgi:hypothetical protein